MNTCPICSSNSPLSCCVQCNLQVCAKCGKLHNSSCSVIKDQKYDLCKQHGKPVNGFCCQCYQLTCTECVDTHKEHSVVSMLEAYTSIKSDGNLFMNALRSEESKLKCYEKNYDGLCNMIQEEEKKWSISVSSVTDRLYKSLLDKSTREASDKLLQRLNGVRKQLSDLKVEQFPLTFLSEWTHVISWLNDYEKVKQAMDDQWEKPNASSISQQFRNMILNHNGSPVDQLADIDMITTQISDMSINKTSVKDETSNDSSNDDGFVHVDLESNRHTVEGETNKEEHTCLEKTCLEQALKVSDLNEKLEHFRNKEKEDARLKGTIRDQSIEIADLKRKLEQFRNNEEEEARLKGTIKDQLIDIADLKRKLENNVKNCSSQKKEIDDLKKNLKTLTEEHSRLLKSLQEYKKQNDELLKNQESRNAEKEKIVNLISSMEQWAPKIIKSREYCEKVFFEILGGDTPDLKACKKKLKPVLDSIVDSTNELISREKEISVRDMRITELEVANGKLRQQQFDLQKRQKQCDDHIQYLTTEKANVQIRLASLNSSIEAWRQQCVDKEKTIQILQTEKDDLQTRLSSIAGDKLAKGNPAITDLSDPNRPMKISEKYGELYDNEWTDAIECTSYTRSLFPDVDKSQLEEIIIRHLYKLLTLCYEECVLMSQKQLQTIGDAVVTELNLQEEDLSNIPGCGEVCKFRRHYADSFAEHLVKDKVLATRIDVTDWDYEHKNIDLLNKLAATPFFEKCVRLCWYMAIHDPVMYLSKEPTPDVQFDKNMYKEFQKSGNKVEFVVWPALYLHEGGPLLFKGVVQAYS